MIAMATDDVIGKGAHAGNLIKAVASCVGGGGGGRPNMAQAGGKNPAGIDELLAKAPQVLEQQLNKNICKKFNRKRLTNRKSMV